MKLAQPGILAEVPLVSQYLYFSLKPQHNATSSIKQLAELSDGNKIVIGLSESLVQSLGKKIKGLKTFPAFSSHAINVPSTVSNLWVWLRGEDKGEILLESLKIEALLAEDFILDKKIDAFRFREGRDLSGYIDGTENPEGDEAVQAAILQSDESGLNGSSFVAVQQWRHNLGHFNSMSQKEQDDTIGRRISDNEEFDEAPESAHVKRTAQESFTPEAFILRRSMPWNNEHENGLVFVAFSHSLERYEAILNRMTGQEDGITDALFNFTHPVTGNYFWCPPVKNDAIDLSYLDL